MTEQCELGKDYRNREYVEYQAQSCQKLYKHNNILRRHEEKESGRRKEKVNDSSRWLSISPLSAQFYLSITKIDGRQPKRARAHIVGSRMAYRARANSNQRPVPASSKSAAKPTAASGDGTSVTRRYKNTVISFFGYLSVYFFSFSCSFSLEDDLTVCHTVILLLAGR